MSSSTGRHRARLQREQQYGIEVLKSDERNWGWSTPAGRIRLERRATFLLGVSDDPEARVLEIGCGTGTCTGALARKFRRLVGVDISHDLLQVARPRVPRASFVRMDAHDLAFSPAAFDAVVGCSVLHHLDWAIALASLRRILKPGGVIRFSEPNLANPQIFLQKSIPILKRWSGDSADEYAFTRRQAQRALLASGFGAIRVQPYEFLHPWVPARAIPLVTRIETACMRTPLKAVAGSLLIEARAG